METKYLFKNGAICESSPVTYLLQNHPGAYTTTRTLNNRSFILFWERHITRLTNSLKILLIQNSKLLFYNNANHNGFPELLKKPMTNETVWDSLVPSLVHDSMRKALPFTAKTSILEEELAITILLSGNLDKASKVEILQNEESISECLDVYVHLAGYTPSTFGVKQNSARLAVVGQGREFANAKYSDWVRARKRLEKLRPLNVTELLLSNDGDKILEGCLTNFFVVCLKESDYCENSEQDYLSCIEIQTAPVDGGVLPGVIRQVIKEICWKMGIPFRETAPSWSKRELWVEAFITNSLRVVEPVESVQVPDSNSWVHKRFEVYPGRITSLLQREIMNAAYAESPGTASFMG